jgi:glycosyltransferase involved in cell wall biosynthesis
MQKQYLADFSLALINRTGAYFVCRDVVERLPQFFAGIRYWRFVLGRRPDGMLRKLLARAMLMEISRFGSSDAVPRLGRGGLAKLPTLFFDPLYVLRAKLEARDIVLCHDVGPVTHTDLFEPEATALYREAYELIRKVKPGMVFVSEASRDAFARLYGTDYRYMQVIPLYIRNGLTLGDETAPPGVAEPFLLTVGAMEIRKNYQRTIPAFAASGLYQRGYTYVFCGPRANNSEAIEPLAAETPGVLRFDYLSDAELRWLYRRAAGFVLPSLLEGFGVPVLEACKYGLIPVISEDGAQREAAGEGAILVDAMSVASIADGMKRLATMTDEERQRRREMVRRHADRLTEEAYIERWSRLLEAD